MANSSAVEFKNVTKEFGVFTHPAEHDLSIYIYEKDDTTGLLKENCHVASLPIDNWKDDDWPKDWREDCNNMTDSKSRTYFIKPIRFFKDNTSISISI